MFFKSLSKAPKHNRFDFRPRYYDPEKEKRQARLKEPKERIRFQKNNLYRSAGSPIVGAFTNRRGFDYKERARSKQKQVVRTFIILMVLLILFVFGMPYLMEVIEPFIS